MGKSGGKSTLNETREVWDEIKETYYDIDSEWSTVKLKLYSEFTDYYSRINRLRTKETRYYSTDYPKISELKSNYDGLTSKVSTISTMLSLVTNNLSNAQYEYDNSILIDGQPVTSNNKPSDISSDVADVKNRATWLTDWCRGCSTKSQELLDDIKTINDGCTSKFNACGSILSERKAKWQSYISSHEDKKDLSLESYWNAGIMTGIWPT